jgi:hypothetical protein
MATVTSGVFSSYFTLRVECYEISSNIASNSSVIRADLWVDFSGSSASSYNVTGAINVNGNTTSSNIGYQSWGRGSHLIIGGFDTGVGHNSDGSKSINFSASFSSGGWGSASTGTGTLSSPWGITDFDFTPSAPGAMTAAAVTGISGRIDVSWGAATSYVTPVTYYHSYRSSTNGGVSYGSWSSDTSTTSLSASYTSLTPGLTYQFRVRAYNGQDNSSGYTESNTVFLTAGGKRYVGPNPVTDWVLTAAQAKRWTGSAWTSLGTLKRFDGTNWVNLS